MTVVIETVHANGFTPSLVANNPTIRSQELSALGRERRRKSLGIHVAVNNRPALCSYDEAPAPVANRDPIEQEALRLAETIRTEYKRVGERNTFVVDFSEPRVLYAALAILNKEGLKLGSMSVGDGGWNIWFYAVEPEADYDSYCGC